MHRSKKAARGKSFKSFVKTISSFYKSKMSTNQLSKDDEYDATLMRLKEEFVEKYHEHEVSDSSEKLKEYKFLAILGQGAFGLVVIYHSPSPSVSSFALANFPFPLQKLVKHEPTENFYAVKILKKERVVKSKQVCHTLNEKRVLRALNFPNVVHLLFSMKDNSYLYFGMPFLNGGEMFTHLRK